MRIAICDDVAADRRAIASALDAYLKRRGLSAQVETFARPGALLAAVRCEPFDLYLLDVLLDDKLTGIDLVRKLRSGVGAAGAAGMPPQQWRGVFGGAAGMPPQQSGVPVVFFSTSREYALDAFAVEAISYLQKPWDKASFAHVLDLAMERCCKVKDELLTFRISSGVVRFAASAIEYVVTAKTVNYITVSRVGGDTFTLRGSVRSFAEQYRDQVHLVPAGRSILVNPAQIASLDKASVRFFSGCTLAVPHSALSVLAKEILALSAP